MFASAPQENASACIYAKRTGCKLPGSRKQLGASCALHQHGDCCSNHVGNIGIGDVTSVLPSMEVVAAADSSGELPRTAATGLWNQGWFLHLCTVWVKQTSKGSASRAAAAQRAAAKLELDKLTKSAVIRKPRQALTTPMNSDPRFATKLLMVLACISPASPWPLATVGFDHSRLQGVV
eukprot:822198-Amphidinium_carterae.2